MKEPAEKKVGLVPDMRSKNPPAALARNRAESISSVLSEMQERVHNKR